MQLRGDHGVKGLWSQREVITLRKLFKSVYRTNRTLITSHDTTILYIGTMYKMG